MPVIGFLAIPSRDTFEYLIDAFRQGLNDAGYIERKNVEIEYRWAEGRAERFTELAAEFARLKVDLIVASTTPAVIAAKQATSVIPIVFASASDPVGTGLVTTLAGRGGNVTGLSMQMTDLAGKRLEILREVTPGLMPLDSQGFLQLRPL